MKFSKFSVFSALLFAVATLVVAPAQPAYSGTVWDLFDHPDGAANPPPYGLRIDGIEFFYQAFHTPQAIGQGVGNSDTWLFSFDHFANTTMTLNDDQDTAVIQGDLFGGRDANLDFSGLGSVTLSFTYNVLSVGTVGGKDALTFGSGVGTLTFNDTIQSILAGSVFNMVSFQNSNGDTGFYKANGHRLGNHGCPDAGNELCQRQVGLGWVGLEKSNGDVFHTSSQDFLYTGDLAVIPLPAALPLFLTGLAGFGLLRHRQRRLTNRA